LDIKNVQYVKQFFTWTKYETSAHFVYLLKKLQTFPF